METATIHYRVADFLKQHPPFHGMDEVDLLALSGVGRVKFYEPNEYLAVQGDPFMMQVVVIQQGTVTLWNEEGEYAALQDVRGAGDFLAIEQFNDLDAYPYSARSSSDVVVYVFSAIDFEAIVMKYPHARQHVAAYSHVTADYKPAGEHRDPRDLYVQSLAAGKPLVACEQSATIREAARCFLETGADAIAVLDPRGYAGAVLTRESFLKWVEQGAGSAEQPVAELGLSEPIAVAANASVADATLAMGIAEGGAVAMTDDGLPGSRVQVLVTPRDLAPVFGDHPVAILREIRRTTRPDSLRELNLRARAFILRHLAGAGSFDWLARFASLTDAAIVRQVISGAAPAGMSACWCLSGAAGRAENLTRLEPELLLILRNEADSGLGRDVYERVAGALGACGYLQPAERSFEAGFRAACLEEWKSRYGKWIGEPLIQNMFHARSLFDLRPFHGDHGLFSQLESAVRPGPGNWLYLLANDCMESLPPLTFFQDAVISDTGERSDVFRLEYSAIRPLVDVGRVFGMASGRMLGGSTLERLVLARMLLPEQAGIFREASDTLRVVLWLQGRVGIGRGTDGAELPPSLLSRYDRQNLRNGFRSVLKLLEFTGNLEWLKTI